MGSISLGFGHPLVPGEIAVGAYVTEAARDKFACDFRRLARTVLEEQPAVTLEVLRGRRNDCPEAGHPVPSRGKGAAGLVAERGVLHRRVVLGDVGRITDDEIEGASDQGLEPASAEELHPLQVE
jgi:hypothetical protein